MPFSIRLCRTRSAWLTDAAPPLLPASERFRISKFGKDYSEENDEGQDQPLHEGYNGNEMLVCLVWIHSGECGRSRRLLS